MLEGAHELAPANQLLRQPAAAQRHALAADRGMDQQHVVVEGQAALPFRLLDAEFFQP